MLVFSLLTFVVGLVGYQANFGLDQLLEVPSRNLGLFIHYATWVFTCVRSLVYTIATTV